MSALRIGLFASHGGSNLQAIIDACQNGTIMADAVVVISNNSKSRAFQRAIEAGIDAVHLSSATHPDVHELDLATLRVLEEHNVGLVALAGYMKRLGPKTIEAYRGRILNIHPALLPKHGGEGLYGERVHQSVLDSGDTESGASIHLVDEEYDSGTVIAQARVPVLKGDTIESLGARVLAEEHILYVETIRRIADGSLSAN